MTVEIVEDGGDVPKLDAKGAVLEITHADGSITVSLDGRPIAEAEQEKRGGWFDNLVDDLDQSELGRIAEDLLRGIADDITSRAEWIDDRTTGLKLLGLKLETPGLVGASDGAPVEGMSKVRHPLLLEAVLRFQANARSELLPTDGPVKVRNDEGQQSPGTPPPGPGQSGDQRADALELDLNHYLTAIATEYYPDTDRMLLMVGFGGCGFKKVYRCPLRNRPVSESVDANDLIVNNSATDLANAKRITHRINMRPSVVKRMQILGVYRQVELGTPLAPKANSVDQEKASQQGVSTDTSNPLDRDREIYECYCELDIKGFEHKAGGKVSGLEIPYRVTIDVSSRQILSIVRNYDEEDQELPTAREVFVKYPYVPGMGFYDIGLLHILGNTTNAVTAAWREMLDCGMYANFPGFLIAKSAGRQQTNIIRVPPGGGQQVDTQGGKIGDAVMPLPYNTQQMPALMQLVDNMAQTGMRLGGTSELQVGEGRPDVAMGTMLAMIEQATKIENAVHKRLHAAQAKEFKLLVDCFREHPEDFLNSSGKSKQSGRSDVQWDQETFLKALDDYELVPQADPNTASHTQRLMKAGALAQAAERNPQLFNVQAVQSTVLQAMGWSNPEQYINANPQPDPKTIAAQSDAQTEGVKAQAAQTTAEARMLEVKGGLAAAQDGAPQPPPPPDPIAVAKLHLQEQELAQDREEDLMEAENRERDRESDERQAAVQLITALIKDPQALAMARGLMGPGFLQHLESNEPSIPGLPDGGQS